MPARAAGRDYLPADNRAYAVRDRAGAGRVLLVTEGNLFLEQIFRSLRGVELFQMAPADALPAEAFDLVVLDGVLPVALPDADLLLVNPPAGMTFFRVGAERAQAGTVAVHPDDPRTRNLGVYMETVRVARFRELSGTAWATTLASVDGFPLVVAGEVGARQVAILPFDARYPNTDMVLQPAWPILIAELSSWFSPQRVSDAAGSLAPGAPVRVRFI